MSLDVDIADRIATVTLNRPPVNALDAEMMREITITFRKLDGNARVSVIVLRAAGEKVFCAGADINDSERRYTRRETVAGDSATDILDPGRVARDCFMSIFNCTAPVISSIQGAALGAGLSLVACTDILVASDRAQFGLPEITVGALGGGRFVQRLVGVPKMRAMFFTGEPVDAAEMHRLGAIEAVVPHERLSEVTMWYARKVAMKSPIGLRLGKQSVNRAEHLSMLEGYRVEQDYTSKVSTFDDAREARNAWREKRDPVWRWQ